MSMNKALFGGALMAAGMTAQAQNFIYSAYDTTNTYASFAYSSAYYGALDISYASGALNTYASAYSYYTGTTTAWTTQSATSMGAYGQWGGDGLLGYGYGGNLMQQFFQVSHDGYLCFEWDFSGTDNYASAIVLTDPALGVVFELDGLGGDPSSGTAMVAVSAGTDYALIFGLQNGFFPFYFDTDVQYITVEFKIPAPGAAALLGMGGLLAVRRRR